MAQKAKPEKIPSRDSAKRYVVEGATLKCSCGSATSELKTPGRKKSYIHHKLQANITDCRPMVNIQPFGLCDSLSNPDVQAATAANHGRLKKMPCQPKLTMKWINGKEDQNVDGAPALIETSANMCLYGGKISIEDDGQNKESGRFEQGVAKMADGGMLMMIGAAALLTAVTVLTAPVSVPSLLVAAGVGASVATAAGAAVTVGTVGMAVAGGATAAMGASDAIEGGQDLLYGTAGSELPSFNPARELCFGGDAEVYHQAEAIMSTTAAVGSIALAPVAQAVTTASVGLRTGEKDRVGAIKNQGNRCISPKVRRRTGSMFRTRKCLCDPVDAITGEVLLERRDFVLPGRILVQWNRHYGSQSTYMGLCGRGWETPGDVRLEFPADGTVLFHDGSGVPACFAFPPETAPVLEPIDGRRLYREAGYYIVRYQEGLACYFPVPAESVERIWIDHLSDPYGNTVQFRRDSDGLREIRESTGRKIEVRSSHGRIEAMVLRHPGQAPQLLARYGYDEHGNLTSAYDALDIPYRFEYRNNLLVRHTNRNGLSFYYEYDRYTPEGRCTHTWGDGGLYEGWFVYHDDRNIVEATGTLGTITFLYDGNYRILQETNPLGAVTKYEYDEHGRTTAVIDPDGHRTGYAYDRSGNLLKLTRPDGVTIQTQFDAAGKPLRVTDPNGAVWSREWDSGGRPVRQMTPLGAVTQYQYDEHGQAVGCVDPLGNQIQLAFDSYGNLVGITDARGSTTRFTYDAWGNPIDRTDPLKRRTTYQYDRKGRLIKAVLPGGVSIACEYDAEDNLLAYRDENGAVTRLEYCGVNELKRRIQPDGRTVEYEYNAEEQLIAVINQRGERYELNRDAAGRITEEVDYWGQSRTYSYSAAGHLRESVDPLGRTIRYQTDPLGRILVKVRPDPAGTGNIQSETFTYDADGNLTACANRGSEVKRCFDREGKLIKEEQGPNCSVAYRYDLNGNQVSRTTAIQEGKLIRTQTVNYSYDGLGQAAAVEIAGHQPIRFNRNNLGQVINETLGNNLKRWFHYDDAGRLITQAVTNGTGPLFKQEYSYDKAGNLIRKEDSVFGTDRFCYDPLGRITRQIDPLGRVQQYLYDQAGDRLVTAINASAPDDPDSKWERTGELAGQTYRFDRAGNLVGRGGALGTTEFVWDVNGRLEKSIRDGQVTSYRYDPLGRRISKETGGVTTRFFWDGDALMGDARLEAGGDPGNIEPVCTRIREWVDYPELLPFQLPYRLLVLYMI
jgi:YD repeat-containing protein